MNLTSAERKKLEKHLWAVHTVQEHATNLINSFLADKAHIKFEIREQRIKYYGTPIQVYLVPFEVVEELVTNKASKQLKFVIYHDEKKDDVWVKWNEGRKNTKGFITPRSALSFPQKRKRK